MEPFSGLIRVIAEQGPWAAVSVCLFMVLVWAVLGWLEEARKCTKIQGVLQEKRLEERDGTVLAIRAANETTIKLSDALTANTEALTSNTQLTVQLAKEVSLNDKYWRIKAEGWEKSDDEMLKLLRVLEVLLSNISAILSTRQQ